MRIEIRGTIKGRPVEAIWEDGALSGDPAFVQHLERRAKLLVDESFGPTDVALAPESVPAHLRSPYRIWHLAVDRVHGLPPLLDPGSGDTAGDWPRWDLPEGAIP